MMAAAEAARPLASPALQRLSEFCLPPGTDHMLVNARHNIRHKVITSKSYVIRKLPLKSQSVENDHIRYGAAQPGPEGGGMDMP